MSKLFSKSEINQIKNSIKRQKNVCFSDVDMNKGKIQDLSNLYGAIVGFENKMKNSNSQRTLK